MGSRWGILWFGIALLVLLVVGSTATACLPQQAYPSKAIEFVVAFPAGGGSDINARINAKFLSAELGVPVNIVNRGGGDQIPAVLSVLSAPADGYTLLSEQQATSTFLSILQDVPFKIEDRAFGPMVSAPTTALVVPGKSPWNSLKDVAEAAKKDPGSFTWTRLGITSAADLSIMKFLDTAGVDIMKTKPVAFEGTGPGLTAVAGGHVMMTHTSLSAIMPLYQSGDLKIMAHNGEQRLPQLPNVPTLADAGFPGVIVMGWYAISGPKDLPKSVVDRLDAAVKKVTQDPAFAKDLEPGGGRPQYLPPDKTKEYIAKDMELVKSFVAKFPGLS